MALPFNFTPASLMLTWVSWRGDQKWVSGPVLHTRKIQKLNGFTRKLLRSILIIKMRSLPSWNSWWRAINWPKIVSIPKWSVIKDLQWPSNYQVCWWVRLNLKRRPKLSKAKANLAKLASNVRGAAELSVCLKGTSLQRRIPIARGTKKNQLSYQLV